MSELATICRLVNEKISSEEITRETYISTENMLPNRGGVTISTSLPSVGKVQAFHRDDILVSNIRPYFKKIWQADKDGGCSNDVLIFRASNGTLADYLYYVLADDSFFDFATASAKGTKMPRGDKQAIMHYEVPVRSFLEQQKIASRLKCLDNKILANNKINDNLIA